ncbi:MAG: hypothetical protein GKR87_06155 [Kiritimatiellae bacterium]|nr:hypothetical protein [Kiritimatiellia bacterium]
MEYRSSREAFQSLNALNAVFCTNHLGQKELQKSLDAPTGGIYVFL